ncbi:hypothetical protein Plhal703r1_c25g0105981 [Plasmopara halstedii]
MSSLIKPITSDHDLIKLATQIGVHLDAIYESNEIYKAISKKGTYLVLLRTPDRDIGHWTCIYDNEYFDSMGEAAPTKYGIGRYNPKQYQGLTETIVESGACSGCIVSKEEDEYA